MRAEYNDLDLVIDEDIKKQLMDNGMFPPSFPSPGGLVNP